MTPYEELKKKICQALPRLMDDVVGQVYERNGLFHIAIRADIEGMTLFSKTHFENNFYYYQELQTRFQPLGIEPTLSDVLEYLGTIGEDDDFRIYSDGIIQFWDYLYSHYCNAKISWDLSQPLLKDQSEELIDYLLRL